MCLFASLLKKTLVFPEEAKLSPDARDIITRMITDSSKRLTFEQIKAHPFFRSVDWEAIRKTKSPIVPKVESEVDTQNFDKFEDVEDAVEEGAEDNSAFIGYTFKRVEAPKALAADFFCTRTQHTHRRHSHVHSSNSCICMSALTSVLPLCAPLCSSTSAVGGRWPRSCSVALYSAFSFRIQLVSNPLPHRMLCPLRSPLPPLSSPALPRPPWPHAVECAGQSCDIPLPPTRHLSGAHPVT